MEELKNEPQKAKLTYEQLENVANQLHSQVQSLYAKLNDVSMNNVFKRLEFLFKVVENSKEFPVEFLTSCITEIMDLMTLKEDTEQKED